MDVPFWIGFTLLVVVWFIALIWPIAFYLLLLRKLEPKDQKVLGLTVLVEWIGGLWVASLITRLFWPFAGSM